MILIVDYIQKKTNVRGDSLEIGVESGKSFILLASLMRESETILAVDVFEDQHLNKDQSGFGIRSHFELNIQAHLRGERNVKILKEDSLNLTFNLVSQYVDKCRFVHIDGCHTFEHTYNDILFAESILAGRGIIIVDDVESFDKFPGVNKALNAIFSRSQNNLHPLFLTGNKLCICRSEDLDFYMSELMLILPLVGFYYPENLLQAAYPKLKTLCLILPKPTDLPVKNIYSANICSYPKNLAQDSKCNLIRPSYLKKFIKSFTGDYSFKIVVESADFDISKGYIVALDLLAFVFDISGHKFILEFSINGNKLWQKTVDKFIHNELVWFNLPPGILIMGQNNCKLEVKKIKAQGSSLLNFLNQKLINISVRKIFIHESVNHFTKDLKLKKGFQQREFWGAWIDGHEGEVEFDFTGPALTKRYLLKIQGQAMIDPLHKAQKISANLNGVYLGEVTFTDNFSLFIDFILPEKSLICGVNSLKISVAYPTSFSEITSNRDFRVAGYGFRGLDIFEIYSSEL